MSELTEVTIRTRNPEHYELINHADGTRWRLGSDGRWNQAEGGPDELGNQRFDGESLVSKIHTGQHPDGTCRQGVTCRKLATARLMAPLFLKILQGEAK